MKTTTPSTDNSLLDWHRHQMFVASQNGSVVPAWLARELEAKNARLQTELDAALAYITALEDVCDSDQLARAQAQAKLK